MPTALLSVSDKKGLKEFASRLQKEHGYEFIATGSTAIHLKQAGIDCSTVDSVTGFPEILGGRVKTLHPRIFAGILARNRNDDQDCLAEMNITTIDMVVVNLYPFEARLKELESDTALGSDCARMDEKIIEEIDIGGVSLLRAAAKNFERVTVICDPSLYDSALVALSELSADSEKPGCIESHRLFRRRMATRAFLRTAEYDHAISSYFSKSKNNSQDTDLSRESLPEAMDLSLRSFQSLRYGENPHQSAVWYEVLSPASKVGNGSYNSSNFSNSSSFPPFAQLQGKAMSSNNVTDTFALVRILRELTGSGACIIKHNNPCGVAQASTIEEAFQKAISTDPISAFGGIFGFNQEVNEAVVNEILKGFVEIVVAPSFSAGALELLSAKKNVRVLELKPGILEDKDFSHLRVRDMQDFGLIVERCDSPPVEAESFECVAGDLDPSLLPDVRFAWGVVKHLTSNAIFLARECKSLGFGIGQTSRIASVKLAIEQAGKSAVGAVMASDAFFPATDNIEAAKDAGIEVIVQPGGSIKDKEVVEACKAAGITMLLTGQRCFRH